MQQILKLSKNAKGRLDALKGSHGFIVEVDGIVDKKGVIDPTYRVSATPCPVQPKQLDIVVRQGRDGPIQAVIQLNMETAEWAITNWWGQVRVLKLSLHTAPQDITEAILKSHVADHLMTGFQNNRRKMTFWRMEDTFNNLVSLLDATLEHRIAIMHDNIGVRQRPYAKVSVYRGETIIATYRVVEISHTEGHAQRTIALVQAYRNWQRWNDEINGPGGRYASHVDDERYEYHTVLENGEQLNVSMSLSRDQYDTPIQLLPELFIMKSTVPA